MQCAGKMKLVSGPTNPVATVAEAKTYLRVDDNGEDTLIGNLIAASTLNIEAFLNRKLITQTWKYFLDRWPAGQGTEWWDGVRDGAVSELLGRADAIYIPASPLQSVEAFKTYGDDDVAVTFSSSNYIVDTTGPLARVALRTGVVWPTTILRPINGIEIEMKLGYGDAASDVPFPIKQAILEVVAAMYERRGDENLKLPMTAMALCRPYRVENL